MSTHAFDLTSFPNGKVAAEKLTAEILAACAQAPSSVDVGSEQATLTFEPDLPAEQEANLAAAVAAHDGLRIIVDFIAASEAVNTEKAITQQTWEVLGGVVTNPRFFIHDPNQIVALVVGQLKSVGSGVELRLVEDGSEVQLNTTEFAAPDTGDAWEAFKFQTDVPPTGTTECLYRLEGRLNGATSASLRFTSMTLLRVEVA